MNDLSQYRARREALAQRMRERGGGIAIVVAQPFFAGVPGLLPASIAAGVAPFWEFIYPTGAEAAGNGQLDRGRKRAVAVDAGAAELEYLHGCWL